MKVTSINRLAFAALLCCGMFLLYSNARAQCPDNTGPAPDPASCPWNSTSTSYTYPGTFCNVTVYYCYRNCTGYSPQVYVTEVDPDPTSDCNGIDPTTTLYDARDAALQDALTNYFSNLIPPCVKGTTTTVSTYMPACWEGLLNSTNNGTQFVSCTNWGCFCQRTCDICWEGGTVGYSISCTNTGTPECDCYKLDPDFPAAGHWQFQTCYRLPCN